MLLAGAILTNQLRVSIGHREISASGRFLEIFQMHRLSGKFHQHLLSALIFHLLDWLIKSININKTLLLTCYF